MIGQKIEVLDKGFIQLTDVLGQDVDIAEKARTSYGKEGKSARQLRLQLINEHFQYPQEIVSYTILNPGSATAIITFKDGSKIIRDEIETEKQLWRNIAELLAKAKADDDRLIRRLMRDQHTSPFEMVEMVFIIQAPMDCWRQWIRHRTASVNEYSTRYMEAIDLTQQTPPGEWRLQATDNKQGSSGFLEEWPEGTKIVEQKDYTNPDNPTPTGQYTAVVPTKTGFSKFFLSDKDDGPGKALSEHEFCLQQTMKVAYSQRLNLGIAKEQARKDLPLSTYTRAYWKCDLHNIFNFLRLRMDKHAQLEIRTYANAMAEFVKEHFPVAYGAFEDYVLHARKFSRMEMEVLNQILDDSGYKIELNGCRSMQPTMTDNEWKQFLDKLS